MANIEFIFLGTGTSSGVPHLDCLTAPPDRKPCRTCLSSREPGGEKNVRRNTGAVLRVPWPKNSQRTATILIDAGKTFQAAALEHFPKYGLRRIDALLITHAHADAFNGLDDLRGWTLNGAIQPHIDIYTSQHTFDEAKRAFPYLVSKEYATGGGDVPEFKWHIIQDKIPFEIEGTGIQITPFAVHHGRIFAIPPAIGPLPTPPSTVPSTPNRRSPTLDHFPQPVKKVSFVQDKSVLPYFCMAFKIQSEVVYISDVSYIPDDVWPLLQSDEKGRLMLVLDCLNIRGHSSHLSLEQAYYLAAKIKAKRTYLTGFSHEVSHEEYVRIAEATERDLALPGEVTEYETKGILGIRNAIETLKTEDEDYSLPIWVRPAHDGLRVFISDGQVEDETYDAMERQ